MEEFLLRLQESDFGVWVSSAPTIFAYPTILMLHTVGLAMIVGPAWVLDVRLLGYGARLPVEALRGAFRIMWIGFFINASTFGSRPRNDRYASAGSFVLPIEKIFLRNRSATALS